MERKGFGPRLGAALIDWVIEVVVVFVLAMIFGTSMAVLAGRGSSTTQQAAAVGSVVVFALIVFALLVGYSLTEVFMAATPGKMILKQKIMRADGTPADQATLMKRWGIRRSYEILGLLAVIPGLAFLGSVGNLASLVITISCFMTLRASKTALHDDWSGTAVYGPGTAAVPSGFQVMPPGSVNPPGPPPAA